MDARFWGLRAFALMLWALLSASAQAATIYDVTGPFPFGFTNQNPVAIGWTQTTEYKNASITIPLAALAARLDSADRTDWLSTWMVIMLYLL